MFLGVSVLGCCWHPVSAWFGRSVSCANLQVLCWSPGLFLVAFYNGLEAVGCSVDISWGNFGSSSCPSLRLVSDTGVGYSAMARLYPADSESVMHSFVEQAQEGFPVSISRMILLVFYWEQRKELIWPDLPLENLYIHLRTPYSHINLIIALHHRSAEISETIKSVWFLFIHLTQNLWIIFFRFHIVRCHFRKQKSTHSQAFLLQKTTTSNFH